MRDTHPSSLDAERVQTRHASSVWHGPVALIVPCRNNLKLDQTRVHQRDHGKSHESYEGCAKG